MGEPLKKRWITVLVPWYTILPLRPMDLFFLLDTFRRFLFWLTEDSVSLALQSCLGGRAEGFHVQFLSTNHFRFSVSCKQVGFHVYRLRRVISSQFDVYFHLWNNGMPN